VVPTVRRAAVWAVVLIVAVWLVSLLMVPGSITTFTLGMTFAIMALSLTLLTGYAGEMNLALMAFAAIGTIVAFHVGIVGTGLASHLTWWGVALGVLATGLVGGVVALPALRLRGLYLALATLAFGGFVANMVLRDINREGLFGGVFPDGNLLVPPLKVGPVDLRDPLTALLTTTVLFALTAVGVIALRRSGYGRRLAAMKDSPAATAMLGQSLVPLKFSVFVISSAIAGLGGIMMSSTLGSVSAESFPIISSLSLLMLTVVGGIGYVTGALMGGIFAGAGIVAVVATLHNLAAGSEGLGNIYSTLASVFLVLTALVGMGVGENPSGRVHLVTATWRKIAPARPVLVGAAALELVFYLLALTGVIGNWWFVALTVALFVYTPRIARTLMPHVVLTADELAVPKQVPLERIGLESPSTGEQRDVVDRALGLPRHRPAATASVPVPAVRPAPVSARQENAHVTA
jgi:ABC-type branched-subunit amino acid transport system permease subunit